MPNDSKQHGKGQLLTRNVIKTRDSQQSQSHNLNHNLNLTHQIHPLKATILVMNKETK